MKILVANLPSFNGKMFVKEGRCSQSKKIWNTIWPPYSLVSIAAVLEESGHSVKIYDYPASRFNPDDFHSFIRESAPEAVIASCTTPTVNDDLESCLKIKQILPDTKIILFGIHGTVFFKDILRECPFIDFIIRGEPEYTVKELISALDTNQGGELSDIKGLAWRNRGNVVGNAEREYISELDELPMPAWHLIDIEKYKLPFIGKPYLIVVPGRGCVDNCSFCCANKYYGRENRRHSAERIIKELVYYKKRFGINRFLFWTENFTRDKEFLNALLERMLAHNLNSRWSCNSRVDSVDFELLVKMKKAGCQMISFGVESGDQRILDAAGKKITLSEIENAFSAAQKAGLQTIAGCIFGLPGETISTMKQTLKFLKRLNPTYVQLYTAVPRPGSEFYELACREKWMQTEDWGRFHQEDYVLNINGLNRDEVVNFIRMARISFYLDFKRLGRIAFYLLKAFLTV